MRNPKTDLWGTIIEFRDIWLENKERGLENSMGRREQKVFFICR
jgi:hypothetical protein